MANRITVPNLELSIFTNSPATVSEEDWVVLQRARAYERLRVNSWKNMRRIEIETDGRTKDEASMWSSWLCVFEQWIRQICFFRFPGNYPPDGRMSSANSDGNEKEMEWQRKRMAHQDIMSMRKMAAYFLLCMTLFFFNIMRKSTHFSRFRPDGGGLLWSRS